MWRHITGVEHPAKQIKLDNNEKLERKMTYDQFLTPTTVKKLLFY
jgi:hypothetical protein